MISLSPREREGAAQRRKGEGVRQYDNHHSGTVQRARQLRRDASEPERRLLRALRETYPYLKWRHQTPLGPFFADMLCFSKKLVIEVDGDTHAAAEGYDASREDFMMREGYRTVRVTNADVMQNLEGVLTQISFSLREKEGARAAMPRGKDEGVALTKKKGGVA
ncbi:very-short-patch-repair endonuclease [Sphingomonas sanguinis]